MVIIAVLVIAFVTSYKYAAQDKIIKILSSIICFFFFVIYEFIDYLNVFLFFLPNLPESFVTEKKWEKILRKLIKKS